MPLTVTSGLGRNGPWLQNDWLRVETRQDDGSISPIALDGAFRPTERALAYVGLTDGERLWFGRCEYDIDSHEDRLGRGKRLTLRSRDARKGVLLQRETVLYDGAPFCVTRTGITNERHVPMAVAAIHAFTTPEAGRGRLQLASRPDAWRIYRNGWQSWSPTMSFGGNERDVRSKPNDLAPEPPVADGGRFASDDIGVLYDPQQRRAVLAGAITARDLLSQVVVDAPGRSIDARCLADGVALDPGDTLWSERFAIDLTGHPNDQLARYGDALGREMGARVPESAPSGWCSWYYFYTNVTEEDVVRNLRFLERHRRELPIDTVQIDDGYQADIGDWLTTNEKFPRGMAWLASEIKRAGYTPGLWLAPFLIANSSKTFAEHPDFVVRNDDGSPAVATANWQRDNYGLDGSNPAARAWLTDLFRAVCDEWGYDYVKIDFLFGAAIKGRRIDPQSTRIRSYRAALDAVRAGVGIERFILGCGSLMAPSVGYFDGNRIGPDVAPFWRFMTRDERSRPNARPRTADDGLSAETAIRNTLTRSWMHNRLWANDPDCLLVRQERTKLTLDETRTLATAIGLSGGMMLVSDDMEHVAPDRRELISMLLPPLPVSATPADLMLRDMPERYEIIDDRAFDPVRTVGLFNFADEPRDLMLELPEGRWHAFELWEERYRGVVEGSMTFDLVAPHACRVVALRREQRGPTLLGTTAHIGMGVLDITNAEATADGLRLQVAPAGKRRRRLYFDLAGREVAATFDGQPLDLSPSGRAHFAEIDVDAPSELALIVRK